MSNTYFQFKQFTVHQDKCAMKVTTDGCLFGAWVAEAVKSENIIADSGLDIGTGTGLLSLMLVQKSTGLSIDAIEIDSEAARQAAENIAASPWGDRINMIQADARRYAFDRKYDIIISNPPFYENELKGDNTQKNTAHHDAGLLLPELLSIIKNNLAQGGRFFLLLPYKRNEEVRELLLQQQLHIEQIVLAKHSVDHPYFRILIEGSLNTGKQEDTKLDEISVKDEKDQYTSAFTRFLKDYYLHL